MKHAIAKYINEVKKTINNINWKSKKTLLFVGFFVFAIATSVIVASYSYYTKPGDKTLIVGGFALVSNADVTIKVYAEDSYQRREYSRIYYIPTVNYTYDESQSYCTDGITINGYENGVFDITSSNRGFCKVYFNLNAELFPTGNFRLFVEQTKDTNDYVERGNLPDNDYLYIVNAARTSCTDSNAVVEVVKRRIEITSSTDATCDVYVDIEATEGGGSMYLSEKIIALESNNDYISSQDQSVYKIFHETVAYNSQTLDAGIRKRN